MVYLIANFTFKTYSFGFLQHHQKKQPFRGIIRKRYSENMQKIHRRRPMAKCDFNKVALELY